MQRRLSPARDCDQPSAATWLRFALSLVVALSAPLSGCGGTPGVCTGQCPCTGPQCTSGNQDTDGDGLPDSWEQLYSDTSRFDANAADSDGDGTPDGDEDYDGDGLTNAEERALQALAQPIGGPTLDPLRFDLLIELDNMVGCDLDSAALSVAATAYAALPHQNPDGSTGIFLHVYRDETDIPASSFSGDAGERQSLFAAHGPHFDTSGDPPIPIDRFVHVIIASGRDDIPLRAGEAVAAPSAGEIDKSGIYIFYDAIAALMPECGAPAAQPPLDDITLDEALANTFTHELGHALQVGHDTSADGGVDFFNVMSEPTSCSEAQERFHGVGNSDATLGNTASIRAPRFSDAAAALMRFDDILSIDTGAITDTDM